MTVNKNIAFQASLLENADESGFIGKMRVLVDKNDVQFRGRYPNSAASIGSEGLRLRIASILVKYSDAPNTEERAEVVECAVRCLGLLGGQDTLYAISNLARSGECSNVLYAVLDSLRAIGGVAAETHLQEIIRRFQGVDEEICELASFFSSEIKVDGIYDSMLGPPPEGPVGTVVLSRRFLGCATEQPIANSNAAYNTYPSLGSLRNEFSAVGSAKMEEILNRLER